MGEPLVTIVAPTVRTTRVAGRAPVAGHAGRRDRNRTNDGWSTPVSNLVYTYFREPVTGYEALSLDVVEDEGLLKLNQ